MSTSIVGLHKNLKDNSVPWSDKLKLARFAWTSSSYVLPNKHQVLLDWVCNSMSASERFQISHDALEGLWTFFNEVLSSKQLQMILQQKRFITLPPGICDTISKTLSRSSLFHPTCISCCQKILQHSQLATTLLSKSDSFVRLLCELIRQGNSIIDGGSNFADSDLAFTLVLALQCFNEAQRQHLVQRKSFNLVLQHLLLPMLSLHQKLSSGCHGEKICGNIIEAIDSIMTDVLFSRDLNAAFVTFCEHVPAEDSKYPKSAELVVSLMEFLKGKCITDKSDSSHLVIYGLPVLFQIFIKSLRPAAHVAFSMFKHLLSVLGIDNESEEWVINEKEAAVFECLERLLALIHGNNVYSIHGDENVNQQTNFLKVLSRHALNQRTRYKSWYGTLNTFLSLNHKLLEEHLVDIWRSLLCLDNAESSEDAKMGLASSILQIYSKLSQFEKVTAALLQALCGTQSLQNAQMHLPKLFLEQYGQFVADLNSNTAFKIWKLFIKYASSSKEFQGLEMLSILFHTFCHNLRLLDFTTSTHSIQQLKNLLNECVEAVIKPQIEWTGLSIPVLVLSCCYGNMKLFLAQHSETFELPSLPVGVKKPLKGGEVHWLQCHLDESDVNEDIATENNSVFLLKQSLILQQVRHLLMIIGTSPPSSESSLVSESLRNLTNGLIENLQVIFDLEQSNMQSGFKTTRTLFKLLLDSMPLLAPYISKEDFKGLALIGCSTLLSVQEPIDDGKEDCKAMIVVGVSIPQLNILKYSESDWCKESIHMQHALAFATVDGLSALLKSSFESLSKKVSKTPKKKRKLSGNPVAFDLKELLSDLSLYQECLHSLYKGLVHTASTSLPSILKKFEMLLKICDSISLTMISPEDQSTLFLAVHSLDHHLSWILKVTDMGNSHTKLIELITCIRQWQAGCLKGLQKSSNASQVDSPKLILSMVENYIELHKTIQDSSAITEEKLHHFCEATSDLMRQWLRKERMWSKESNLTTWIVGKVQSLCEESQTRPSFLQLAGLEILTALSHSYLHGSFVNQSEFLKVAFEYSSKIFHELSGTPSSLLLNRGVSAISKLLHSVLSQSKDREKLVGNWLEFSGTWLDWLLLYLTQKENAFEKDGECSEMRIFLFGLKFIQSFCSVCGDLPSSKIETLVTSLVMLRPLIGHDSEERNDISLMIVQLLCKMNVEDFQQWMAQLIHHMNISIEKLTTCLHMWGILAANQMPDTFQAALIEKVPLFFNNCLLIFSHMAGNESTVELILETAAIIVAEGKALLDYKTALPTQMYCLEIDWERLPPSCFPTIFQSACKLLNNLLMSFPRAVMNAVPSYMACIQNLLRAVMQRGQQANQEIPEDSLYMCSQCMGRLLTLLASRKDDVSRVVAFLVAEYINCLQQGTPLPAFKKTLVIGIYHLVEVSDPKVLSMLHMTLPSNQKEVFKSFMGDYDRYFKYKGKV